jgi:hypothetical protein
VQFSVGWRCIKNEQADLSESVVRRNGGTLSVANAFLRNKISAAQKINYVIFRHFMMSTGGRQMNSQGSQMSLIRINLSNDDR